MGNVFVLCTCENGKCVCIVYRWEWEMCWYCEHVDIANVLILRTCGYCKHVDIANVWILRQCWYCEHVDIANVLILRTC
jgi:hypothetical protein